LKILGLIGYPLTHSFSKKYFTKKFEKEGITNYAYELFPLKSIEEFRELERNEGIIGLNVTIPYKEQIVPFLDRLDESAAAIGAVNVIKIQNGEKIGFNSDYFGFKISLQRLIPENFTSKALILGTGGAAKAVQFTLEKLNIPYQLVSRDRGKGLTYQDLNENPDVIKENYLIINTTPLGTLPNVDEKPDIPYHLLSSAHYLHDLVYNPAETAFMRAGIQQGAKVKNGYDMLVEQANKAWEIWHN
jgi:shikimate dehydrogenase